MPNFEKAITLCEDKKFKEIYIIGGEKVYNEALNLNIINNIYMTKIKNNYECDTFFPEIPDHFCLIHSNTIYDDDILKQKKNELEFCTFQKIIE